jgi:hypothetical protein
MALRLRGKFITLAAVAVIAAAVMYLIKWQLGAAQENQSLLAKDTTAVGPHRIDRRLSNDSFGVGEWLQFEIGYGFINAGTATMEVTDVVDYHGRPAFQIVTTATSNKFFTSFYPVKDRVESLMDAVGLFSWRFEKNLREGNYRNDRQYEFDQINHSVIYKNDTISVAAYVQDALSALYFIRTQKLEIGKSLFVDNFTDGKNYPLEVKVYRKEKITTKAGEFECLVVEPLLQTAGIFQHQGKLTVWLTDDRAHIPVMMKSKVVVGAITAELTEYKLGQLEEF